MSPKKGDRVSVPPPDGRNVVFATTDVVTGWEELCRSTLSNAHRCLDALRTAPLSHDNWNRQHQLRGGHATKTWKGSEGLAPPDPYETGQTLRVGAHGTSGKRRRALPAKRHRTKAVAQSG